MKTKHPYLKEILKTVGKVALIGGATLIATPYVFGFAAGLFNMMTAGYVAGYATAGLGAYTAIKTAIKDAFTMRERVKKQQQEEHVDEQLAELKKELKKVQTQKANSVSEKHISSKTDQKELQTKKKPKWKINPFFLNRIKQRVREHTRAA